MVKVQGFAEMVKAQKKAARKPKLKVGQKGGADARFKIIAKNRGKVKDARDRLVSLNHASGVDARNKLTKIRNLKKGMLDVKTTAGGAITISKTTQGKTVLTTKKKTGTPKKNSGGGGSIISKNVTKTVSRAGIVSLKTKNKTQATLTGVARGKVAQGYASAVRKTAPTGRTAQVGRTASAARPASAGPIRKRAVPANTKRNLTRTIQGEMSEAARLDEELMNTRVDPVILKRTVNQDVVRQRSRAAERMPSPIRGSTYRPRRSPSPYYSSGRVRSRSRSPINVDLYDTGRRGRSSQYHYDDPRRELEREESYSRRLQQTQIAEPASQTRTMADRYESHVSPLEGAKVVVTNLQNSVTKDDIVELFGDVGALKRAKVASPGSAEVVFVNRSDAQKAVEIYHNRQLDGKAMKCQMVGTGGMEAPVSSNSSYRLPSGGGSRGRDRHGSGDGRIPEAQPVEINSIHRALFPSERSSRMRPDGDSEGYRRRSGERSTRRY